MKRLWITLFLVGGLGWSVSAQEATPNWDAREFIIVNHVHQISGATTIAFASLTGAAGIALASGADWPGLLPAHKVLALGTVTAGAATLALGLTAFSQRLDTVWPHVLFMGLAETGWILNAFVLEPGSLPHRITGAASIVSLGAGIVSIILING